jgi:hypothetical protein
MNWLRVTAAVGVIAAMPGCGKKDAEAKAESKSAQAKPAERVEKTLGLGDDETLPRAAVWAKAPAAGLLVLDAKTKFSKLREHAKPGDDKTLLLAVSTGKDESPFGGWPVHFGQLEEPIFYAEVHPLGMQHSCRTSDGGGVRGRIRLQSGATPGDVAGYRMDTLRKRATECKGTSKETRVAVTIHEQVTLDVVIATLDAVAGASCQLQVDDAGATKVQGECLFPEPWLDLPQVLPDNAPPGARLARPFGPPPEGSQPAQ